MAFAWVKAEDVLLDLAQVSNKAKAQSVPVECDQGGDLAEGVPVPPDAVPGCWPYGPKCHARKGHIDVDDLYLDKWGDVPDPAATVLREHVDEVMRGLATRCGDTEDNVLDLDRDVNDLSDGLFSLTQGFDKLARRVTALEHRPPQWWPYVFPEQPTRVVYTNGADNRANPSPPPCGADNGTGSPPPRQQGSV
jgi:hypothetical protein